MSLENRERFLSRWSRRKLESAKEESLPKPAAPISPAAPAAVSPASKAELPSIDSLRGLASEYQGFLHPDVDDKLRQVALKKLFRDPHFNVMDGLDTYIDDYSKPDPIPEAMLEGLKRANRLLFPEKAAPEEGSDDPATGETADPEAASRVEAQGETRAETPPLPSGPQDQT